MDDILTQALAATTIAKVGVDLLKLAIDPIPRWIPVAVAVFLAIQATVLLQVAVGVDLTPQVLAQCVLGGILAAGSAVGVTTLHQKARGME